MTRQLSGKKRDQLHSPEYMKQSETNHTINSSLIDPRRGLTS